MPLMTVWSNTGPEYSGESATYYYGRETTIYSGEKTTSDHGLNPPLRVAALFR
jgi:hypothetical protein